MTSSFQPKRMFTWRGRGVQNLQSPCLLSFLWPSVVFTWCLQLSTSGSLCPCLVMFKRMDGDSWGQEAGPGPRGLGIWSSQADLQTSKQVQQMGGVCQIQPWLLFYVTYPGFHFYKLLEDFKKSEEFIKKNLTFWLFLKTLALFSPHCMATNGFS